MVSLRARPLKQRAARLWQAPPPSKRGRQEVTVDGKMGLRWVYDGSTMDHKMDLRWARGRPLAWYGRPRERGGRRSKKKGGREEEKEEEE